MLCEAIVHYSFDYSFLMKHSTYHSAGAEICSTKREEKNTLTQQHTYISIINMLHACCSVNAFDFPLIHMPASFILTLLIHMVLNSFDVDSVSFFFHKNFMVTNVKTHTRFDPFLQTYVHRSTSHNHTHPEQNESIDLIQMIRTNYQLLLPLL